MKQSGNIVFIGPMAVGKSAVGRLFAQLSGASFVDTDRLVVERHGRIEAIFESRGEPVFRRYEAEIVREVLGLQNVVVSLGGGAVLHPETQQLLREATVVFLDTDLATVLPRISGQTGRPMLAGRPEERWQQLYDARRPIYEALATVVLDTRGQTVRACADAVLAALSHDQSIESVTTSHD